jgi:hypothetical protein
MSMGRLSAVLWSPAPEGETALQSRLRLVGNLSRWAILIAVLAALTIRDGVSLSKRNVQEPVRVMELGGIEIGMSTENVIRARGFGPRGAPARTADGVWSQRIVIGDLLVLLEGASEDDLAVWRVCETNPRYDTHVAGISGWESEDSVLRKLGRPSAEVADEGGPGKAAYFEPYNLMVLFGQGRVTGICIGV